MNPLGLTVYLTTTQHKDRKIYNRVKALSLSMPFYISYRLGLFYEIFKFSSRFLLRSSFYADFAASQW
ncbi:hypothetical protein ACIN8IBEIGE_20011 [Acinetobacter sp. 8I-beige]|nr:hypothetical protein ACIN8IBEIGE_20011 [Acinetobacter sp. 8I-beige]